MEVPSVASSPRLLRYSRTLAGLGSLRCPGARCVHSFSLLSKEREREKVEEDAHSLLGICMTLSLVLSPSLLFHMLVIHIRPATRGNETIFDSQGNDQALGVFHEPCLVSLERAHSGDHETVKIFCLARTDFEKFSFEVSHYFRVCVMCIISPARDNDRAADWLEDR